MPDRNGLPPLSKYATLHVGDGRTKAVGATEASRGCKHLCRHCPVVPIYGGQFRIVPRDVVLADIDAQVAAGAEHITFGDPDFFNGPTHAMRVVEALHAAHPDVTYDVTIKIEHLLQHRDLLGRLRGHRLRVRHERRRVDRRPRARVLREGAHAAGFRRARPRSVATPA